MAGDPTERQRWKDPLHSLQVELENDFGLTRVASRALIRRLAEFLDTVTDSSAARGPGQIAYTAVAAHERAGKPLRYCTTVPVHLTVFHSSDARVLHESGSPSLRRIRLRRITDEAYAQGAALSYEDLSALLAVEQSTVRRMVQDCAQSGRRPPTRGVVADIGPAISHKESAIRLYIIRGMLPGHIAARTGHSIGSIERYLLDFARVVELARRGSTPETTVRLTGLSRPLVRQYLMLADELDRPVHQVTFDRLLARFAPLESVEPREASDE